MNDNDGHTEEVELNSQMPFMEDSGEFYYSNQINLEQRTSANNDDELINSYDDDLSERSLDDEINYINETLDGTDEGESINPMELSPQRRCASHMLNLVSSDFEKELTGTIKTALIAAISKLHALWVLVGRSTDAKGICLSIAEYVLNTPCITRWNSKFDSVNQAFKLKHKINPLILELKVKIKSARNLTELTTIDWGIIEDYLKICRPVACALDKLQAETNGSQGYIVPTLNSVRHHITEQTGRSRLLEFKRVMLKVIDRRFGNLLKVDYGNYELLAAAASLPRFKTNSFQTEDDKRTVRNILIDECKRLAEYVEENNEPTSIETVQDDFYVSFEDFYVSFGLISVRRESTDNQIENEVLRYLSDDRKHDSILDEYPMIRNVYFKHNTTLAASAVVERLFSQSLMIFTPRRNRISPQNFEKALLLKCNRKIFEK